MDRTHWTDCPGVYKAYFFLAVLALWGLRFLDLAQIQDYQMDIIKQSYLQAHDPALRHVRVKTHLFDSICIAFNCIGKILPDIIHKAI